MGVISSSGYMSELTPSRWRSYNMILLSGTCFLLGEIYADLLLLKYMPTLKETEHWQLVIALGTVPMWLMILPCYFLLEESPQFLAVNDRCDEAAYGGIIFWFITPRR